MESILLEAAARKLTDKGKALRAGGRIPAIYYGRARENMPLQLEYQKFKKVFEKAGENTIVELSVDGKKYPVLVYDVQYDPISDAITHVDFMHVDMQKEVTTSVKVVIVGVAPAVKNLGGILDIQKHEIKIKCLPKDLIHSIEVDVSGIVDFHTSVHVKDLKLPSVIKILDNETDTVVTAVPPKAEEEEVKPAEAVAVPAEGAAPAGAPAPGAPEAAAKPGAPLSAAPAPQAKEAKK